MEFFQGDIIKISGFKNYFLIVSENAFIKATNVFHIGPVSENNEDGPLHIAIVGKQKTSGTVFCEQMKLIDPSVRACNKVDRISYDAMMNISDAIQGIFEYD